MLKNLITFLYSTSNKQHKVLKALYNKERSCPDYWYYGSKGLDFETLDVNFNFNVTEILLDTMFVNGYIRWGEHTFNKNKTICLTELGAVCFLNSSLVNNVWYRSRDFWIATLALLTAIVGLFKNS